ncbi:MAG: hypothetical protein NZ823_02815 [Blastocatellia bacterium]|nr:hypothetical protein [Blastocatellia bacterium]
MQRLEGRHPHFICVGEEQGKGGCRVQRLEGRHPHFITPEGAPPVPSSVVHAVWSLATNVHVLARLQRATIV